MPRHARAPYFLKSKLFDDLNEFAELEARIKALPTKKERGDAFEVFAEAYLAIQKTTPAKEVWPFDSIPESVKQRLVLDTGRDMGVDGVVETLAGEYDGIVRLKRVDLQSACPSEY